MFISFSSIILFVYNLPFINKGRAILKKEGKKTKQSTSKRETKKMA